MAVIMTVLEEATGMHGIDCVDGGVDDNMKMVKLCSGR
jgi:hypothetical protein